MKLRSEFKKARRASRALTPPIFKSQRLSRQTLINAASTLPPAGAQHLDLLSPICATHCIIHRPIVRTATTARRLYPLLHLRQSLGLPQEDKTWSRTGFREGKDIWSRSQGSEAAWKGAVLVQWWANEG
jgi:hypothetical protein